MLFLRFLIALELIFNDPSFYDYPLPKIHFSEVFLHLNREPSSNFIIFGCLSFSSFLPLIIFIKSRSYCFSGLIS